MKIHLREARAAAGMTQQQVADSADISVTVYQRYERGNRLPGVEKALLVAKAIGTTVERLYSLD